MKNKALLDANVLIAAFDESHAEHRRARDYVAGLREFHTCPQTQGAFLRFFTRPWTDASGVRREPRLSTGHAMSQLRAIVSQRAHRFLPDSLPFTSVSLKSLSGFKQWNDAYLIALARQHKLELATLERKLDNMDPGDPAVLHLIP